MTVAPQRRHRHRDLDPKSVLSSGVHFLEQTFQVLAQVCTVLGLEGTQFVDLAFEQCALLIQLRKNVLVLVLCVSNNFVALCVCVGDDATGFFATIADVLVVDALCQWQQQRSR